MVQKNIEQKIAQPKCNWLRLLGSVTLFAAAVTAFTLKANSYFAREKQIYSEAITENTRSITHDASIYSAYVQEGISEGNTFYNWRTMTLEDRDQKAIYGRLKAIDYNKDGIIDEIDTSQIPNGNSLEKMTLQEIQKAYTSFTSAVDTDGKRVAINQR